MKRIILVCLISFLLGGGIVYLSVEEQWLTAPLRREGSTLLLSGPDLSQVVNQPGFLHTYYQRGYWIPLTWKGYLNGANTWEIPEERKAELKANKLDWEKNQGWAVDFLATPLPWIFQGAYFGTTSK